MPLPTPPPRHDGAYLILLQQVLVAQDLALTIADRAPGARVIVAQSCAEALAALGDVERVETAFLALTPPRFEGSALAEAIALRGGRVVLLGDAAETAKVRNGWRVLAQPFSTDAVLALIA